MIYKSGDKVRFNNLINFLKSFKTFDGIVTVSICTDAGTTLEILPEATTRQLIKKYEDIMRRPIAGENHRDAEDHKMLSIFRLPMGGVNITPNKLSGKLSMTITVVGRTED